MSKKQELTDFNSPQTLWKCACPSWTTRRGCFEARYGFNEFDEECECACHEIDEDDDDPR